MGYLSEWKESVDNREGFEDSEKSNMLLSRETLAGINITGDYDFRYLHAIIVYSTICSLIFFGTGSIYSKASWGECFP